MKKALVFIFLPFCFLQESFCREFSITYYPEKVIINPSGGKNNDAVIIVENKLFSNLFLQILSRDKVIGNMNVKPSKTEKFIVKKNKGLKLFIRTIQPAMELIELKSKGVWSTLVFATMPFLFPFPPSELTTKTKAPKKLRPLKRKKTALLY